MIDNSCAVIPRVNLLDESDERGLNDLVFGIFRHHVEVESNVNIKICCECCYVVQLVQKYLNFR